MAFDPTWYDRWRLARTDIERERFMEQLQVQIYDITKRPEISTWEARFETMILREHRHRLDTFDLVFTLRLLWPWRRHFPGWPRWVQVSAMECRARGRDPHEDMHGLLP